MANPNLPRLVRMLPFLVAPGREQYVPAHFRFADALDHLIEKEGAVLRHDNGTTELQMAGVVGTATSGRPIALLGSWVKAARNQIGGAA